MMKKLKPTIVLTAICVIVALLLAGINMITAPEIAENELEKTQEALREVLPEADVFEQLTVDETFPTAVKEAYKSDAGFVFKTVVKGYASGMQIMVGIDLDGKIVGSICTDKGGETYGHENALNGAYNGKDSTTAELIIASGATPGSATSKGYYDAIKAALLAYDVVAKGAVADNRSPEQIIQDDCNAAFGTEGKVFTKWFATEVLDGVSAVYECDGGRVFVIGEKYIGYKDGAPVGEVTDEESEAVAAADALVASSTVTEITLPEGASANVLKAYVTASGNYVFKARGAGYDKNNEYSTTKEYIYIKLAISKDGKIIDVLTTAHHESEGIGDKCASSEFYSQLIGKDSTNHSEITISGATVTTNGYHRAIRQSFEAFALLTQDNSTEGEG